MNVNEGESMPLTPADVRNKQFNTSRLRPGYDEQEVDAFLDEAEEELDRLNTENEELRAKLAEVLRGGKVPLALGAPRAEAIIEAAAVFAAGSFIVPFMRAFAAKAGEDAYGSLKGLLGRFIGRDIRIPQSLDTSRENSIIRDEATGTTLVVPMPMTDDVLRELSELDPSSILGKTLVWMPDSGRWLIG
jgi:DivIVA domain-containing protein